MLRRSSPCTKLHKVEQKDRTKTLAEFPDHILNDFDSTDHALPSQAMKLHCTCIFVCKSGGLYERKPYLPQSSFDFICVKF